MARNFLRAWSCLSMLMVMTATIMAAPIGVTPLAVTPGAPTGAYSLSGFDNINLYNGSLGFRLPLLSMGGRGGAGHTVMLPIEKKWQVETYTVQGDDYTETHYYPDGDWWEVTGPGYGPGLCTSAMAGG